MTETGTCGDGTDRSEEPYWVVVSKLNEHEYATAAVNAPTEDDARAEGERLIVAGEQTTEYQVKSVRGPFPKRSGEAAPEVRPGQCHGCGLHCWDADGTPCPHSTWFERDGERDDSVPWRCITCGTLTVVPNEVLAQ